MVKYITYIITPQLGITVQSYNDWIGILYTHGVSHTDYRFNAHSNGGHFYSLINRTISRVYDELHTYYSSVD